MKRNALLLFLSLFCSLEIYSQSGGKVDYNIWNSLLSMYVNINGLVDYNSLDKSEPELDKFLEILSTTKIDNTWSNNDKMAYWINVYNAFTIKLVLKNYPIDSIKDLSNPWGKEFFKINGVLMSLGHVEHKILRKFNDPRIHFAINCASLSCPRIIRIPYKGKNVDRLLERQTLEYLNNKKVNIITDDTYQLSKLFSWFKKDFKLEEQSLIDFVNKYSEIKISNQKNKGFLKYNWKLNSTYVRKKIIRNP